MKTNSLIHMEKIRESEKSLIEDQLELILASKYFNSAKQMQRFLEYIVKKTIAGQGNYLKQYTIGVDALDFSDDFDSDNNPAVRIMGGRVRNRLREFYENTENNQIIIEIPKGAYTPEFSWNTDDPKSKNDENIKCETSSGPRIALVSYSDKTQSKLSNHLILRVTDVLARELSKFVLAKFSVYNPLTDKSQSYKAHTEIHADFMLNLYVQELPTKKHELLCRLTDGNGEVQWSESYCINVEVPIAEQEDIFARLITMIVDTHQGKLHMDWARQQLLNEDKIPKRYQAVAYYRQFYDHLDLDTFTSAVSACEAAVQRNPDDIIANIFLSDLCRREYVHDFKVIDSPIEKGIQYAERATHLRHDSHEAHYMLAQILFSKGDWDRSLDEFVRARKLNHFNAVVEYAIGYHFCLMDKWEEGIPLVKKAISMSSNYPSWYHTIISLDHYNKGEYQLGLDEADKVVSPGLAHGPMARCIAHSQLGNIESAKKELKEIALRIPNLEQNFRPYLKRILGNDALTEKISEGIQIAMEA